MQFHQVFCLAVLGVSSFAVSGTASTLAFGFESPYSVGNINGQQGWSNTGNYDAQVSSSAAFEASQSLRISNAVATGSYGDQTFTPHLAVPAGESTFTGAVNTFLSSWYFKSVTDTLQNGLGITVSADNGLGARMSYVRMAEDATNGLNLQFYDTTPTGAFVFEQLTAHLDLTTWHRVDMNIYFVDGHSNDVVKVFLDGKLIKTGTSWEDFYRNGPANDGGGGGLNPVNSLLFRAGGDPVTATLGKGFFIDNVSLSSTSSEAPEPGTVGLLLAGIAGMVVVARRKRPVGN